MESHEILHIAVAPPAIVEANLIKEVATIINIDLYTARYLLAGKIPRIIAHYQTVQTAESDAERLRNLGLKALKWVCSESTASIRECCWFAAGRYSW